MDETATPPAAPTPAPDDVSASVDPGPFARAAWKVRLAVTFFVLAIALVTAEGLARSSVKRETALWVPHRLCFAVQAPDRKVVKPLGDATFEYETNHFGFRGKSLVTEKRAKDAYRIVFLGDEATLAASLPEAQTYPALIETTLNGRRGERDLKVETANASGPGFTIPVLHATLVGRVLPLEPDMVVVMSVANDVRAALATRWDEEGSALASEAEPAAFADWLCSVSDFAYLVQKKARKGTPWLERTPLDAFGERDPKADPRRALASYRRSVHLMAAACKEAKAELVLLTQPTLYKESSTPEENARLPHGPDDQLRKGIDAFNEELRSEAPRTGARLVDVASLVTRDLDHLKDDVSFTPSGHTVVANVVIDELWKDQPAARQR